MSEITKTNAAHFGSWFLLIVLLSSVQFVREELEYEDNFERQARFHGNDDHITVDDLWRQWVRSEGML
jgi:hypothetical protein